MEASKKVLIVEDDVEIAEMYRIKFEKEGFQVHVCTNGLNAVADVTNFMPDAILLDIMMPSMDGFETLRVMRQLAPSLKVKIIMFTNLNSQQDIDRCMTLGADDFLLKANTTPREAVERVQKLLMEEREIPVVEICIEQSSETFRHQCPGCQKKTDFHIKTLCNNHDY